MQHITIFLLVTLIFSCNSSRDSEKNQELKNAGVYIDVPFVQEYHEGYMVDEQTPGSNDVRAIQPDSNNNIWIATKVGVYMKNQGSRTWELMMSGTDRGPAYDVKTDKQSIREGPRVMGCSWMKELRIYLWKTILSII